MSAAVRLGLDPKAVSIAEILEAEIPANCLANAPSPVAV
jgi:hypothetical protein